MSSSGGGSVSMEDQTYCLKWNNHQSNLLGLFGRLFSSEQFTDVVVTAEGRSIRAHKMVLSACSPYFEDLFLSFTASGGGGGVSANFNPSQFVVCLKDTSFEDAVLLVEFMYRGEINVPQNRIHSLLKTAENLRIRGLADVDAGEEDAATPEPHAASSTSSKFANRSPSKIGCTTPNNNVASERSSSSKSPKAPPPQSAASMSMSTSLPSSASRLPPPISGRMLTSHAVPSGSGLDMVKRKRGRPRILDSPGELPDPCFGSSTPSSSISSLPMSSSFDPTTSPHKHPRMMQPKMEIMPESDWPSDIDYDATNGGSGSIGGVGSFLPTPGGPLTADRVASLGIVKMNAYLVTGTRQQFWEEYFVKVIMQAVRNKEVDMKGAAELLGVSYGTLYGRYREVFGYLKHGWNSAPSFSAASLGNKVAAQSATNIPRLELSAALEAAASSSSGLSIPLMSSSAAAAAAAAMAGAPKVRLPDLGEQESIFEHLRTGKINMKQAGNMLGIDTSMLAYQLAGKISDIELFPGLSKISPTTSAVSLKKRADSASIRPPPPPPPNERRDDNENEDEDQRLSLEIQPDIVMDEDDSKDGSNAAAGEEEEAVDPLEEHEKRLQLARQNQEKGEPDKTEAKN